MTVEPPGPPEPPEPTTPSVSDEPFDPLDLGPHERAADDRVEPDVSRSGAAALFSVVVGRIARVQPGTWASWIVVGGSVLFTLAHLAPSLIVTENTPTGGDMGAHVWAPAYLRDNLLPEFRLTGWTDDWYAGFPALQFYFVPPMLAIVLLDVVFPYGVAFKMVVVSGILALPVAAWAFGRLAGLVRPVPELLAVGAVAFSFDPTFRILGGNILSTMAGEFSFTISLSLALVYLGLVANGLQTGRYRAIAAVVVAFVALCHVIPLFFAIAGTFVLLALYPSAAGLRWVLTTAPVGALLSLWWLLPFWWQRTYMNDMGWMKVEPSDDAGVMEQIGFWLTRAFPEDTRFVAYLAGIGLLTALARRAVPAMFFVAMILLGAVAFVLVPEGRLWNARVLPFVHLGTYLLAAFAVGELARWVIEAVREQWRSWSTAGATVLLAALGLGILAFPLHSLPFGEYRDGYYRWPSPPVIGTAWPWAFETTNRNVAPDWAEYNFAGYEGRELVWPEHEDMILTMTNVGQQHGCGRAMWEFDRPTLDRYGTNMAPMLLPMWTDGCIGSMKGLYFESASTAPTFFQLESSLSEEGSRTQRHMPYSDFHIELGVRQAQLMGVRYYMTLTDLAERSAIAHPDLTEIARSGPWTIFELADAPLVEPLANEPIVLDGVHDAQHEWIPATADWFQAPARWDLMWASDGPDHWQRHPRIEDDVVERRPQPPVEVSGIEVENHRIRFEVSEPGTPVLVKVSYFPNWQASGADGPWRVAPNLMLVVPTDTTVELHYGRSGAELAGWGLTGLGVVLVILLARSRPLVMPRWDDDPHGLGDRPGPGVIGRPSRRPPPDGEMRLSVVVPAYEEATVIAATITELRRVLGELDGGVEIVVVDDGSTDDTSAQARDAGADQVLTLEPNAGKGAAVRSGALAARGRTIVFTDADLAYAPDQIPPLLEGVESGWDVVVGSRYAVGSTAEVAASRLRRAGGRVVNLLVRFVLVGNHADTQCGLKAFRSDVARVLFSETRIDRFAFDVELFALAERHRLSLLAVPVRVVNSTRSSLRITRDMVLFIADLARISWWLRRGGYPEPDLGALPSERPAEEATEGEIPGDEVVGE